MTSSPSGSRLRSLRCLWKSLVGRVRENPQSNKYYKYKDKKFQCLQVCHCPADMESFEWRGNEKTPVSDKAASPIRDHIFWKSNKGHWYCIGCIWSEDSRSQSVCAGRWQSSVCGWYGMASRDGREYEKWVVMNSSLQSKEERRMRAFTFRKRADISTLGTLLAKAVATFQVQQAFHNKIITLASVMATTKLYWVLRTRTAPTLSHVF